MSLAESLESAAEALPDQADQIRPANGDPFQLLELLNPSDGGRVLAWLFGHDPDSAAELATAWLEDDAGAVLVLETPLEGLPKTGRKALRRLIHQARSRGVTSVVSADTKPKVSRLPDLNEKISTGHVSPYDPRGGRLVYLVESSPSGGARVFEALLDGDRGIVDFQVYRAGRRQVGAFIRDLKQRSRFPAVDADPDSVRALIGRRLAAHPADRPLPKTFSEWRGKLGLPGDEGRTPGDEVRSQLGAQSEAAALDALAAEVVEGRLGPWPPGPSALEKAVALLRDEFGGPEADPSARKARAQDEVRSLFQTSEAAAANAERFEETAYLYWRDGREDLASACLSTADGLRGEEVEGGPVLDALVNTVANAVEQDLEGGLAGGDGSAGSAPGEADD